MSNYKYHVSTVGISSFTYTLEGIEYLSGGPEKTIDVLYRFGGSNIGKFVFAPGYGFPIKGVYKSPGQLYPDESTWDSYTDPEFPFFNGPPMVYEGTAELTYTATYTGPPEVTLTCRFGSSVVQSITFTNGKTASNRESVGYINYAEAIKISDVAMSAFGMSWTGKLYWSATSTGVKHHFATVTNGSVSVVSQSSQEQVDYIGSNRTIYITSETEYAHSITYKKNDGTTGTFGTQTWKDGNSTIVNHQLLTTSPTRSGYVFRGWSLQSSQVSEPWKQPGEYVTYAGADLTLYALWEDEAWYYRVHYFYNDGSGNSGYMPSSGYYTSTTTTTPTFYLSALPTLTRHGYTFLGWGYTASATTYYTTTMQLSAASHNPDSPTVNNLYAIWEKNAIGLFYWDGASGTSDSSIIAADLPVSNITAARWNRLKAKIAELAAAQGGSWAYREVQPGDEITAGTALSPGEYRKVRTGISNRTGHGTLPAARSTGDEIIASDFNGSTSLKSALNAAIQAYNSNL